VANYESGYLVIQTPKARTDYDIENNTPEREHIAMLDVANFLDYFGNPGAVAKTMESMAKELMLRWRKANSNKASLGTRKSLRYKAEICRYIWKSDKNREECSIYEWELSTFHHTRTVERNMEAVPKIAMSDIKVSDRLIS
jgi:hypothetical protein